MLWTALSLIAIIVRNELRAPPVELLSNLGWKEMNDRFIPLMFFDYGEGRSSGTKLISPGDDQYTVWSTDPNGNYHTNFIGFLQFVTSGLNLPEQLNELHLPLPNLQRPFL